MAYTIKPPVAGTVPYFTAYLLAEEPARFSSDVLLKVRRDYFTSGKKQKDRLFMTAQGESIRCAYAMEKNKPLKWKKEVQGRQEETAVADGASGYRVESQGFSGAPVKKAYFDNAHAWLRTEYFDLEGKTLNAVLMPWTNERSACLALYPKQDKTPILLKSVPMPEDETLLSDLVREVEPQACAQTQQGLAYFCDDEKLSLWEGKLEQKAKESNKPRTSKPRRKPGGFQFDKEALRADAQTLSFDIRTAASPFTGALQEQPRPAKKAVKTTKEAKTNAKAAKTAEILPEKLVLAVNIQPGAPVMETPAPVPEKRADKNKTAAAEKAAEAETVSADLPPAVEKIEKTASQKKTAKGTAAPKTPAGSLPADKVIALSAKEKGLYFGPLDENGRRTGMGRTQLQNGRTLYDGDYLCDMRDGFGAYYFKTGRLSYVGGWKENKRSGFGIAFRPMDGSVHVGVFEDDHPKGVCARFDKEGRMTFAGNWKGGTKNGAGIALEDDGSMTVTGFVNDRQNGTATVLDSYGRVLYSGGYKNGQKEGEGLLFHPDGTLAYSGAFHNGEYEGEGTLYLEDGGTVCGEFAAGKANGRAVRRAASGALIYDGLWKDGLYNGLGRLYRQDGAFMEGLFQNGSMHGEFTCFAQDGAVTYKGTLKDGLYDGHGMLYRDGSAVYDGAFAEGEKSGIGREYEGGVCVYMGSFAKGGRSGFGILCSGAGQLYSGFFEGGVPCGQGVSYAGGRPRFAGFFEEGKPHGRINEIEGQRIAAQCIFEHGACRYERRFRSDGSLAFEGNIKDGKPEGMGASFNEYGEKTFEGIFKYGEPFKSMKVITAELAGLPYVEKLKNTDYETFRTAPEYAVEQPLCGGVYSGGLKNGLPHGKGTMLYPDHRYTGSYSEGKAAGEGVVYLSGGEQLRGRFLKEKTSASEHMEFLNAAYDYEVQP